MIVCLVYFAYVLEEYLRSLSRAASPHGTLHFPSEERGLGPAVAICGHPAPAKPCAHLRGCSVSPILSSGGVQIFLSTDPHTRGVLPLFYALAYHPVSPGLENTLFGKRMCNLRLHTTLQWLGMRMGCDAR